MTDRQRAFLIVQMLFRVFQFKPGEGGGGGGGGRGRGATPLCGLYRYVYATPKGIVLWQCLSQTEVSFGHFWSQT